MVLYSPQHEGGTLHLPSPTHCHTFDATSTLLQLRRSLSRSPSKSPAFRLVTTKPHSPSARSALSPSPLSPHRHVSRLQLPGTASTTDANLNSPPHSPLGVDMPASQRTTRAYARKFSPLRASINSRSHLTGRTPSTRRALGESVDSGNVGTPAARKFKLGAENSPAYSHSASVVQPPKVDFKGFVSDQIQIATVDATAHDNSFSTTPQSFNFRSDKQHPVHLTDVPVKSSPLKRTDAPSKTDPTEGASPSAKRRSLHGASDFDIFDQFTTSQLNNVARTSPEYVPMPVTEMEPPAKKITQVSPIQKRTSSLRKTTLQQRHQDRPMLNRSKASSNFAQSFVAPSPYPARTSTDRSLRRNLFFGDDHNAITAQGFNAENAMEPPRAPARHPLSRTMTQSSSGSEPAQDSPTHIPLRAPERRPPVSHFARSLPIGHGRRNQTDSANDPNGSNVAATPQTFKDAQAIQQPFMSTGLISKRTKHLQDQAQGEIKHMPDTPCKRPMPLNPLAPGSIPAPAPRHTQLRRSQHSFGSPSTPFNGSTTRPSAGAVGKGVGIFGSTIRPLNRRGSFLRVDSEDNASGASAAGQSFEAPPTPSKEHASIESATPVANFNFRSSFFGPSLDNTDDFGDEPNDAAESPQTDVPCKFVLNSPEGFTIDADGDSFMQDSPSAQRKFNSLGALSRYSGHRRPSILGGDHSPSPTPQSRKSHTLPHIRTSNLNLNAQTSPGAPASPLFEHGKHMSPSTPRDGRASVAPPDPSGLSISGQAHHTVDLRKTQLGQSSGFGSTMLPPATPTANRESSRFHSSRAAPTASSHAHAEAAADPSLRERFDTIKVIGEGEFSTVFEVARKRSQEQTAQYFDSLAAGSSMLTIKPPRSVWAVKKSRHPFNSKADRNKKLREAEILRELGQSDHTIQFEDCWEFDQHLYIQTEFCEEGSLDKFLIDCGSAARLDDFRVWKIMLEISLGVKYIHDKGFIHLDLKPANILITFEGTLKIADFGLAASWPAKRGIDGEGDREYIGPEILRGNYDKPADIFALGMIMFEIAGNVVLPENGPHWQRLRSGDLSDVASLTSSSELSMSVSRDDSGRVLEGEQPRADPARMQGLTLATPPDFMASKEHPDSLDQMVAWMSNPQPELRPQADDLLTCAGIQWVAGRRRAGATIYEGVWGPADDILAQDAEMMDV